MTITTNPARIEYTATPGQQIFYYTWKIYASSDLNVYVTPAGQDANDGADLTVDYVVDPLSIADENGGIITFNLPVAGGDLVTIVSAMDSDRLVDYQDNGDFIPGVVNLDIDRTVSLVKQVENLASRTVQFQESEQNASGLTLPKPEAGLMLLWNQDETGFVNDDGTGLGAIGDAIAAAAAAIAAAIAAAASAAEAADSAAAAAASETLAQAWAENPYLDPVIPLSFSALHWATVASNAASQIPTSPIGFLPFVKADGSADNIDLFEVSEGDYELPFFKADGGQDNIAIIGI